MEISENVNTCHVHQCETTNEFGFIRRLRKSFRLKKTKERRKPKKKELIQQGVDNCNEIAELRRQLQIKKDETTALKQQTRQLKDYINKIVEEKAVSGNNVIIGDENVMIVDVDLSHIKKKINRLVEISNDEFDALADRHAELRLKLESIESVLSNVHSKFVLMQTSNEKVERTTKEMKLMIEKLTEAKDLIDIIRQDSITDEMILEAADAVKYQTREIVPEIGLKLARCLAIKYVAKPEKLYASFRDVAIHPLGERLTPDGLGNMCAQWLVLWMKNKNPNDLVYKLRALEQEVVHDETMKIRQKLVVGNSSCNPPPDISVHQDVGEVGGFLCALNKPTQTSTNIGSITEIGMTELSPKKCENLTKYLNGSIAETTF